MSFLLCNFLLFDQNALLPESSTMWPANLWHGASAAFRSERTCCSSRQSLCRQKKKRNWVLHTQGFQISRVGF